MENEIVLQNRNLIYKAIHICNGSGLEEDLFQVGAIGLIKAYRKYDPSFGCKLSSYAFFSILGEIRKYIRENKGVKVSTNISKLNSQIERAYNELCQQNMRAPSFLEIAQYLQISEYQVMEAIYSVHAVESLDAQDEEKSLYDIIPDKVEDLDALIMLKNKLETLNDFEKKLIHSRYVNDCTQSETARILGISQVQVSRGEQKILTKIRKDFALK